MKIWLACLAVLLLAACAATQEAAEAAGTLGPPLQRFTAEGRISLRQGDQASHMRFRWEHTPDDDALLFMSPLGQGIAELLRDSNGARLMRPDQAVVTADTLPQLARRLFDVSLPLDIMTDWMRGARPALGGEVDGWHVVISETSALRQRRLLRVMAVRREGIEFKLVVDEWDAPE